jgi:hypothetical protein
MSWNQASVYSLLMRAVSVGLSVAVAINAAARPTPRDVPWHFVVAGDSRNCGDVVMPSIAAGVRDNGAAFYWHLGDLRAIYDFDEDFKQQYPNAHISDYLSGAWTDFQRNQIEPFGDTPFYLGIGNHETFVPKSRDDFVITFADWLNAPAIRQQRLKDDVHDHQIRPYYHWMQDGIDFIYLDNATEEQFDPAQLKWLNAVLDRDQRDSDTRAVVVGMHEALPESLAHVHSMNDFPQEAESGRVVYTKLLEVKKSKPVYILASHSHFIMEGIYDTTYWRAHGGILPGWIVGTAGAVRYKLPPESGQAKFARTHVYGYLLATVLPRNTGAQDPVHFEFKEVGENSVPASVVQHFGEDFVHRCYHDNAEPGA